LNFNFADPLGGLTLNFADLGGSTNLSINGVFRFLEDLSDADGQVIAGVTVDVEMLPDGTGILRLRGTISSFAIGGQELWIDRLCKHPQTGDDEPGVHVVDVVAGQRVERIDFGNARLGEIHGRKWLDRNGNSERDENEPALPGWTIYLDLNNNGQLDEGEPSVVTDEGGNYWFTDLLPGTYTVAEVLQPGWEQTFPSPQPGQDIFEFEDVNPSTVHRVNDVFSTVANAGAVADVTLGPFFFSNGGSTSNGSAQAADLGTDPANQVMLINNTNLQFDFTETLAGLAVVFFDGGGNVNLSINGQLRNEANLSSLNGQTIGGAVVVVNQVTDNLGILVVTGTIDAFAIGGQEFWIDNLAISGGVEDGTGVHVVDIRGDIARERNFGNRPLRGEIHGNKFIDFDGDGIRGPNDRGVFGWTIYLDLNNNGRLDDGEPTIQTDENGDYWFTDLVPGTYVVRELQQDGWTRTSPIVTFTGRQYEAGVRPTAIDAGDINGDAAPDLVMADEDGNSILVLLNEGDGTYAAGGPIALDVTPIEPKLVDLDQDGDRDLLVVPLESDNLAIYLNDGKGVFTPAPKVNVGMLPVVSEIADFNGDDVPDVALADGHRVAIFYNSGGMLVNPQIIDIGEGQIDLVASDFNHDEQTDLAVLNQSDSNVVILLQDGKGIFAAAATVPVLPSPDQLAVADFDQDGNLDLAVISQEVSDAAVYFGLSSVAGLTFDSNARMLSSVFAPTAIAAADIDGDEFPDVLVTDVETNDLQIHFGRGDRTFRGPMSERVGDRPSAIVVGDFNADSLLDIATADSEEPGATVLLQGPRDRYVVEIVGGDSHVGRDFGNFRNGRITGRKLHDVNCDGILTGLEPGLPGFTIYLDLDEDGVFDPNEPFDVSDAGGNYAIENVPPGTYSVREVLLEDWAQSFPITGRHIVTVSQSNQTVLDIHFGNFQLTPLPDGKDGLFGAGGKDELYGDNVIVDPCILSLGDDDHLFGLAGDDLLVGQLRNDTYHFGPAPEVGNETDTIIELEDGGTNERWDEGIFDQLHFDGVPEEHFPGLGPDEPVLVDLSGASPVFTFANQIAQHENPDTGVLHIVVTKDPDQHQFIEQMVGGAADDTLIGNARDNLLDGRFGSDILQGAAGDDTYVFINGNPTDNDTLIETIGSDTLDFHLIPEAVTVDLATPPIFMTAPVIAMWSTQTVETPAPGLFENIIGTAFADVLRGSAEDNRIEGGDEDDDFYGLAGDDELIGGPADDTYFFADGFGIDEVVELAAGGNDFLDFAPVTVPLDFTIGTTIHVTDGVNEVSHNGLNVERVRGGASLADSLTSGDGDNLWIITGVNTGTLNGVAFEGIENLQGGVGNDTFQFMPGGQITGAINGGDGDDVFDFTMGGSVLGTIIGGMGDDTLIGDDANRTWAVTGAGSGNATAIGAFDQMENLTGGAGIDTFTLSGGTLAGTIDGDAGLDVFNADNVMNLFTLNGDDQGTATGIGAFVRIENLTGNDKDDRFQLGTGTLSGVIQAGLGNDTLVAGDAPTTFTLTGANQGTATGVSSFAGIENLEGGAHSDQFVLAGGTLSGTADGMAGNDTLVADNVANTFTLTAADTGNTTGVGGFANVENLTGNAQADIITIGAGSLSGTFRGEGGTDTVQAADVPNFWGTIGPNTGFVTSLAEFVGVETLTGGTNTDTFLIFVVPFAGTINGQGGVNTLAALGMATTFTVTGANSGNVSGVTTFSDIANLVGGSADDTFVLSGGTITGMFMGGAGLDTLVADNVASVFEITGPDSGTLNGTPFSGIENLTGGNQADEFQVSGGSLSGTADGGAGADLLVADNLPFNVFLIDEADGGMLTGVNRFASIENLTGNDQSDSFWLAGGTLTGMINGGMGTDFLIGDHVPGTYTIDGANSGQATGIGGGFADIENIAGGSDIDNFIVTPTGTLDGSIFGADGDDVFMITPGVGTTFNILGGGGLDQLTVDAQSGIPTLLANTITIAPGGAMVTFFDVEDVGLACDTCLVAHSIAEFNELHPPFAPASSPPLTGDRSVTLTDPTTSRPRTFRPATQLLGQRPLFVPARSSAITASRAAATAEVELTPQFRPQPSPASLFVAPYEQTSVGHFTTSGAAPVGFHQLLQRWEDERRWIPRRSPKFGDAVLPSVADGRRTQLVDAVLADVELFLSDLPSLDAADRLNADLIDAALNDEQLSFIGQKLRAFAGEI
jgi:Ca2+-binding RTX toxin-like protein